MKEKPKPVLIPLKNSWCIKDFGTLMSIFSQTRFGGKKAQANYKITYKDPTYINGYYYNIPYENIRNIYEQKITESKVKSGAVLDQEKLEDEVKRITEIMQEKRVIIASIEMVAKFILPQTLCKAESKFHSPWIF